MFDISSWLTSNYIFIIMSKVYMCYEIHHCHERFYARCWRSLIVINLISKSDAFNACRKTKASFVLGSTLFHNEDAQFIINVSHCPKQPEHLGLAVKSQVVRAHRKRI